LFFSAVLAKLRAAGANTATATLATCHSADFDQDARLSLTELLRVIELYNFRDGTVDRSNVALSAG
tara:strand:- start:184 stop:381 length:198 start_codon:yes stop_codon:yes gene_type:complete